MRSFILARPAAPPCAALRPAPCPSLPPIRPPPQSTFVGDFRAYKAQIAAQYNGVALNVKVVTAAETQTAAFLAKSPLGKLPLLETPEGALFESNAVARYVAKVRRDTELTGRSFFQQSEVDSWLDFVGHDLETPVSFWLYPVWGIAAYDAAIYAKAAADTHAALGVLERHLALRTFLVGEAGRCHAHSHVVGRRTQAPARGRGLPVRVVRRADAVRGALAALLREDVGNGDPEAARSAREAALVARREGRRCELSAPVLAAVRARKGRELERALAR